MSSVTDIAVYGDKVKPGDVFVLEPANGKTVISLAKTDNGNIPVVMNVDTYWKQDEHLTKEARKEYKRNYEDWHGRL